MLDITASLVKKLRNKNTCNFPTNHGEFLAENIMGAQNFALILAKMRNF